jgi:hypothetical protein
MSVNPVDPNANSIPSVEDQFGRMRRGERRGGGPWIIGIVMIVLGVVFMLQNMGQKIPFGDNWWAVFILIPALGAFGTAYNLYQRAGRLDSAARASLFGGIMLTTVAAVFFFGLSWLYIGPALIILAGLALLINSALPQ